MNDLKVDRTNDSPFGSRKKPLVNGPLNGKTYCLILFPCFILDKPLILLLLDA